MHQSAVPQILSLSGAWILKIGDSAVTHFIREWTNGQISLVRVRPETGRTHQIRGTHETHRASASWRFSVSSGRSFHEPSGTALCIPDLYTPNHG